MPIGKAVDDFLSLIADPDVSHLLPFSSRSAVGSSRVLVLSALRKIAVYLAGGESEVGVFFKDFFDKNSNRDIRDAVSATLKVDVQDASTRILKNIGTAFQNSNNITDRRNYLQFACDKTRRELTDTYGFAGLGADMHATVRKMVADDNYEYAPPKRDGTGPSTGKHDGRAQIDPAIAEKVRDLWYEYSIPSSECILDTYKNIRDGEPVRVLTVPPSTVGNIAKDRGYCCRKTALKYKPPHIIRPSRKTDYCHYCSDLREKLIGTRTTHAR